MKSLSQYVNEALFETRFATGEIVQFVPNSTHCAEYGLDGSVWLTGKVEEIIIGKDQQYYNITGENGYYFNGIPEGHVKQDVNDIFTRTKIVLRQCIDTPKHPLEDILDMNK